MSPDTGKSIDELKQKYLLKEAEIDDAWHPKNGAPRDLELLGRLIAEAKSLRAELDAALAPYSAKC